MTTTLSSRSSSTACANARTDSAHVNKCSTIPSCTTFNWPLHAPSGFPAADSGARMSACTTRTSSRKRSCPSAMKVGESSAPARVCGGGAGVD